MDLCIPERTTRAPGYTLDRRALLVLLRIDGATSVRQIAEDTELSLHEVLETFFQLLVDGVVEIVGEEPPRSGVFTKMAV